MRNKYKLTSLGRFHLMRRIKFQLIFNALIKVGGLSRENFSEARLNPAATCHINERRCGTKSVSPHDESSKRSLTYGPVCPRNILFLG